jgi:hypothetical protein
MIGNAKMHGMSAEMVAEAKRCCDFIKTLSDMAEIQYYNPQKNEAVHFTFIDNRSVHLRQNINAYTTFNIFTITSSARHKETAAADSAMPMGAEKATVSDRRKRSSSRERANPGSGTKAIKHPKLPKSAQEFPSLGFRGSKNDRYALLTVLIHAIENNMGRLIEDEIWLQIESDVTLKKLFKDKWKPNFSNAKKDLIAIFNHYGIRWHFVGRTFQLERDKYGNILELKNLRDALRKDTTNRRA